MGNTNSNNLDQTWVWIGVLGLIGLIIGLILLFAMENKAIGAIILIISIIALILAGYLWWVSQRTPTPINNF